ncbi:hypothetical protein [Bowdeniella massiliensis]|uniref:hypothetical protein n=1 Tax=Bowdeniella massiliensis TaxID=2932264 RepID=UPI0020289C18|nr:hypothetical protein [Bowdeniella massiliensis]
MNDQYTFEFLYAESTEPTAMDWLMATPITITAATKTEALTKAATALDLNPNTATPQFRLKNMKDLT